jgi:hypothetical protein
MAADEVVDLYAEFIAPLIEKSEFEDRIARIQAALETVVDLLGVRKRVVR